MALHYAAEEVPLADCPFGLFLWHETLALKTQYRARDSSIVAYVVSSGECFYGDARLCDELAKLMVRPVISADEEAVSEDRLWLSLSPRLSHIAGDGFGAAPNGRKH
jgi:hypothetical protein